MIQSALQELRHSLIIGWIAMRELLYERVFYLLLGFGIVSLGLGFLLGQLTYAEQSKLTVDFLLASIHLSMTLFSVFMGISLFHRELSQGSISMVLSKPISRTSFILGKFIGQVAIQALVIGAMAVMMLLASLRFDDVVSQYALAQTVSLIFLETSIVTAITYVFAVNAGAVTAAIGTLFLFALGHLGDLIGKSLTYRGDKIVWRLLRGIIPDLEVFNMKALASYGQSITLTEMGWAVLYAGCCIALFLSLAAVCFNRKDIVT